MELVRKMKIRKLTLLTNKLEEEKLFYSNTLGFELKKEGSDSFTIRVGWSELTFKRSKEKHTYHYCFLIPSNQLHEALEWMEERVEIIAIENEGKIQWFDTWNARSFYFYDASGNLAEFIVRYDLENESNREFGISSLLCVNEIGMATTQVEHLNSQLERQLSTQFWKGDLVRFATNGSQEGLFLIPNYEIKTVWFPSRQPIVPEPFETTIENEGVLYDLNFRNEQLEITKAGNL